VISVVWRLAFDRLVGATEIRRWPATTERLRVPITRPLAGLEEGRRAGAGKKFGAFRKHRSGLHTLRPLTMGNPVYIISGGGEKRGAWIPASHYPDKVIQLGFLAPANPPSSFRPLRLAIFSYPTVVQDVQGAAFTSGVRINAVSELSLQPLHRPRNGKGQ